MTASQGIDPRGPRFGAGITGVLLIVVIALGLAGATAAAFWLLVALAIVFAWGAFAGIQRHPYGLLYKSLVRPRLKPPTELEDPAPPTFAQGVGLFVTAAGIVIHVLLAATSASYAAGTPWAVVIAAAFAFVAAFLNSVFGLCLGCQLYLLLVRAGVIRRRGAAAA